MSRSRSTRWAILAMMATCVVGGRAVESRFGDVLYLDEAGLKLIPLKTLRAVPLTFSRDQSTVLASLRAGQTVWLVGYAETRFYVQTIISTGLARGWVDADALQPLSLEQRASLDHRRQQTLVHKAAIARREVMLGMTAAEVLAALGPPTEKSRSATAQGEEEVWSYITYRSEPYTQTYFVNGQHVYETLYRKVPVGSKQITFRDGVVVAIRENETNAPPPESFPAPVLGGQVIVVPGAPGRPSPPASRGGRPPSDSGGGSPPAGKPKPPKLPMPIIKGPGETPDSPPNLPPPAGKVVAEKQDD